MSYQEWTNNLVLQRHDPQYWHNILVYAQDICVDFSNLKQHRLAKKLNMAPATLSIIKPLIFAYVAKHTKEAQ